VRPTLILTALVVLHAGGPRVIADAPKPLRNGYVWQQNAVANWGIKGPDGNWYVPPRAENNERLARGEVYTVLPEYGIPRGYWESPCLKECDADGNCKVVRCRMPDIGQHGQPLPPQALAAAKTASEQPGFISTRCFDDCKIEEKIIPIPLVFSAPGKPELIQMPANMHGWRAVKNANGSYTLYPPKP